MIINTHIASDCQLITNNCRQYNYFSNFNVEIRNIISDNISEIRIISAPLNKITLFNASSEIFGVCRNHSGYNFLYDITSVRLYDEYLSYYTQKIITFPSCDISCDEVFLIKALEYKALMHCIELKYNIKL